MRRSPNSCGVHQGTHPGVAVQVFQPSGTESVVTVGTVNDKSRDYACEAHVGVDSPLNVRVMAVPLHHRHL